MTAISDLTTICTILKGSVPTNAQLGRVAALWEDLIPIDNPTTEQRAQAALIGMRADLRKRLRIPAEKAVYSAVIAQAHYPADQPALLEAARAEAEAAGDAAEGDL